MGVTIDWATLGTPSSDLYFSETVQGTFVELNQIKIAKSSTTFLIYRLNKDDFHSSLYTGCPTSYRIVIGSKLRFLRLIEKLKGSVREKLKWV